jgi:uncharacterized lipoprotein
MKSYFYHLIQAVLLILPALLLTACSTAKEIPEYTGSRLLPPLDVPPDLDSPVFNERMRIPDATVAGETKSGVDMPGTIAPGARSIEEPPVFLEEK